MVRLRRFGAAGWARRIEGLASVWPVGASLHPTHRVRRCVDAVEDVPQGDQRRHTIPRPDTPHRHLRTAARFGQNTRQVFEFRLHPSVVASSIGVCNLP